MNAFSPQKHEPLRHACVLERKQIKFLTSVIKWKCYQQFYTLLCPNKTRVRKPYVCLWLLQLFPPEWNLWLERSDWNNQVASNEAKINNKSTRFLGNRIKEGEEDEVHWVGSQALSPQHPMQTDRPITFTLRCFVVLCCSQYLGPCIIWLDIFKLYLMLVDRLILLCWAHSAPNSNISTAAIYTLHYSLCLSTFTEATGQLFFPSLS